MHSGTPVAVPPCSFPSRSKANDSALRMWDEACELIDKPRGCSVSFFDEASLDAVFFAWEQPPADIYEDDSEIGVATAMASMTEERMQMFSKSGALVVRGWRTLPLIGPAIRCADWSSPSATSNTALHASIKTAILPARNERDLNDIPADARAQLEFVWLNKAGSALDFS